MARGSHWYSKALQNLQLPQQMFFSHPRASCVGFAQGNLQVTGLTVPLPRAQGQSCLPAVPRPQCSCRDHCGVKADLLTPEVGSGSCRVCSPSSSENLFIFFSCADVPCG